MRDTIYYSDPLTWDIQGSLTKINNSLRVVNGYLGGPLGGVSGLIFVQNEGEEDSSESRGMYKLTRQNRHPDKRNGRRDLTRRVPIQS